MRTLILVLTLICNTAIAQITITPRSPAPYGKIVAMIEAPRAVEGTTSVTITLKHDTQIQVERLDGGRKLYIWALPGRHELYARVLYIDHGKKTHTETEHTEWFTVAGPGPVITTLRDLVTVEQASKLSGVYNVMSTAIGKLTLLTLGEFERSHDHYIDSKGLTDHGATLQVESRLGDCLANVQGSMSLTQIGALAGCLASIADDFGSEPGKRILLIINESKNRSQRDVKIINELQTTDIIDPLTVFYPLDPDSELAGGEPDPLIEAVKDHPAFGALPAVFVLDFKTRKVIGGEAQPGTVAGIVAILKKHGG